MVNKDEYINYLYLFVLSDEQSNT